MPNPAQDVSETTEVEAAARKIAALNLDAIKIKLMDVGEGAGWSRAQCELVEKWYKRFLLLNVRYPTEPIVPTREIDEFWHYHILDTRKYADDCHEAFGFFLHHFPYFGMRGTEDARNLREAFDRTVRLFCAEFGESLDEIRGAFPSSDSRLAAKCDGSHCGSKDCSKCGKSCSASKCNPGVDYSIRPAFD